MYYIHNMYLYYLWLENDLGVKQSNNVSVLKKKKEY